MDPDQLFRTGATGSEEIPVAVGIPAEGGTGTGTAPNPTAQGVYDAYYQAMGAGGHPLTGAGAGGTGGTGTGGATGTGGTGGTGGGGTAPPGMVCRPIDCYEQCRENDKAKREACQELNRVHVEAMKAAGCKYTSCKTPSFAKSCRTYRRRSCRRTCRTSCRTPCRRRKRCVRVRACNSCY